MARSHDVKLRLLAFFLADDLPDPAEAERAASGSLTPGGLLHKLAKRLLPVPVDASTPVKVWSSLDQGAADTDLMRQLLTDHARVVGESFTDRRYYHVRRKPFRNGFLGECTLITILDKRPSEKRATPPAPSQASARPARVSPKPPAVNRDFDVEELDELVRMALAEDADDGVISPPSPPPEKPVPVETPVAPIDDDATVEDIPADSDPPVRVADKEEEVQPPAAAAQVAAAEQGPTPDPRLRHVFLLFEKSPWDALEHQAALKRNKMLPGGQVETLLRERLSVHPPDDCRVTVVADRGERARSTAKARALVVIAGRHIGRQYVDKSLFSVRLRTFRDDQLGRCSLVRVLSVEKAAPAEEPVAAPVPAGTVAPEPAAPPPPAIAVPGGPFLALVAVFLEGRPADEAELTHFAQHGHPLPQGVIDRLLEENLPVRPEPHVPLVLWPDYGPDAARPVALRRRVMQTGREVGLDFEDSQRFVARGKRVFDDQLGRGVIVSMLSRAPMIVESPPVGEGDTFLTGAVVAPEGPPAETLVEEAPPAREEVASQDVAVVQMPVVEEPEIAEAVEPAVEGTPVTDQVADAVPDMPTVVSDEQIPAEPLEEDGPTFDEDDQAVAVEEAPDVVAEEVEPLVEDGVETPPAFEETVAAQIEDAEPPEGPAEAVAIADLPVLARWEEPDVQPPEGEEAPPDEGERAVAVEEAPPLEEPMPGEPSEAAVAEDLVEDQDVADVAAVETAEEAVAVEDLPVLSLWEDPAGILDDDPDHVAVQDVPPAQTVEETDFSDEDAARAIEEVEPVAPEPHAESVAVEDIPVLSLWEEPRAPVEESPAVDTVDTRDHTPVPEAPPVSLPGSPADVPESDASSIVLAPATDVEGPPLVADVPVLDEWVEDGPFPDSGTEGVALDQEPAGATEELLEEEAIAQEPPAQEIIEEEAIAEAPPIADLPVLGIWEEPVADVDDGSADQETRQVAEEVAPADEATVDDLSDQERSAAAMADLPVLDRWTDEDDRAVAELLGEESPSSEVVEDEAPPEAGLPQQDVPIDGAVLDEETVGVEEEALSDEDAEAAVMDFVEEPPAVAPWTLDQCLDTLAAGIAPLRDSVLSGEPLETHIFEQLDELLSALSEHVSWGTIEAVSVPASARALRLVNFDILCVYRTIGARMIEVRDQGAAGVAVQEVPDAPSVAGELRLAGLGLFFACVGAVARRAESEWDTDALDRAADVVCVAIDQVWLADDPDEMTALDERLSDVLSTLGHALLNFNGNARLIEIAKRRTACRQANVVVRHLADIRDPKLFESVVEEHRATGAPDIEILDLLVKRNGRKKSYPTLFVRVHAMMSGVQPFDLDVMVNTFKEIGAVKHDDAPSLVVDALDAFGGELAPAAFKTLARMRTPKTMDLLLTYVAEDDDPKTSAAVDALAVFRDHGLFDVACAAFAENPRLAILDVIAVCAPRTEVRPIMEWTSDFQEPRWRRRIGRTCSRIDLSETLEHAAAVMSSDPNALTDSFLAGMLPEASERIHRRLAPLVFAWGLRLTFSADPEVVATAHAFLERLLREHAVHRLYELCQRRLHTVTDVLKHQQRRFLAGPPEDTPTVDAAAWLLSGFLFIRRLSDEATIISLIWKSPNAGTLEGLLRILASRSTRPVWKLAWRLLFGTRPLLTPSQDAPSLLVQVLLRALSFPETSEAAHESLYRLYPQFPIGAQDAINAALPTSDALAAYIRKVSLINARAAADYLRNTIYDDAPPALRELHNDLRRFIPVASALEASRDHVQTLLDGLFSEDAQERIAAVSSLDVCAAEEPFNDLLKAWLPRLRSADPKLYTRVALALASPIKISDDDTLDWRLTVLEHIGSTNAALAVTLRLLLDAAGQQQFQHVLSRLEKSHSHMPWDSVINVLYGEPVTTLDNLRNLRPELAFAAVFALWKATTLPGRWGSRSRDACRHLAGNVLPAVLAGMFDNLHVLPSRDLLETFLETAAALCDRYRLPDLRDTFLEPNPDFAWVAAAGDKALHNATAFASQVLVHPAMLSRAARLLETIAGRHEDLLRTSALRDQLLRRISNVIFHPDAPVDHRLACAKLLSHIVDPDGENDQALLRRIAALDALADLRGTPLPHEKLLAELIERWSAR